VARLVQLVLLVEVVVFTASTIPGVREPGFDPLIDGWLQGAAYVTTALLCVLRPIKIEEERRLWSWLAAALVARAFAFVMYLSVVRELDPVPYPSISDVGWLAMCVLVLIALVTFIRSHFTRVSTSLVLDGLVGAAAIAGVALALLYGTLVDLTASGTPSDALVTNLAYPIADVALLLVILGMLVAFEWRPPATVWLLGAAIAAFAVLDTIYLYQVTAGEFRPGTPLSALSVASSAAIAFVAWVPSRSARTPRSDALPGLVVPTFFALVCLGLLVYASVETIPLGAVVLAASGMALAIVRAALTVRDFQRLGGELKSASQAKTEFLSGVSHELRTPLNSILGFAQLIELDATDDDQRESARRIIGAGNHLVEMIDDLVDISRLERGELRAELERVAADDVLRDALDLAEPLIAERDLGVEWEGRGGSELHVVADFRRLRQVLLNLIANAVKYNRPGGKILLSTAAPAPETVRFDVADTGVGIAESDLRRLFEPFERLDGSDAEPGTGLGLAISKGLIEEMGGAISVDSELGVGTTFHVDMPRAA
jgi:signal transduction histidine kinase